MDCKWAASLCSLPTLATSRPRNWACSPDHRQLCQVIESRTFWGEMTCRLWLLDQAKVLETVLHEDPKLLI